MLVAGDRLRLNGHGQMLEGPRPYVRPTRMGRGRSGVMINHG
ncbi:hypothetical protein LX90_004620 [Lentzea flava]|nr:hypothetical protein [Lentzea flava]